MISVLQIATSHGVPLNPSADVPPEGQALELAALQAKLDEANARAAEQKSRYKHLKGKYLRQLARQQAMHEYMVRCPSIPRSIISFTYAIEELGIKQHVSDWCLGLMIAYVGLAGALVPCHKLV
jgi:hypothetical protein